MINKVYIVMGNDFPDAVFSNKTKAEEYVEKKKTETPKFPLTGTARIYWRCYEFELNPKN